jgi:hypothetical protein
VPHRAVKGRISGCADNATEETMNLEENQEGMCYCTTETAIFTKNIAHNHLTQKEYKQRRMASSGMLRRVALVRTEVSEKLRATVVRVTRIGELETSYD